MKLEELSNNTLYKLLKTIYNNIDDLGDLYDDYTDDTSSKIKETLKYIGTDNDFLNIQYIYVCLRDNWDELSSDTPFELIRPTLKNYHVTLDVDITKSCTESYIHKITSYDDNVKEYINKMYDDGNFYPTDGKFVGENCDYYDTTGFEISDVEEA